MLAVWNGAVVATVAIGFSIPYVIREKAHDGNRMASSKIL